MGCSATKSAQQNDIENQAVRDIEGRSAYNPDIINPGDEIEILVWQHEDFNTQSSVTSKGTIAMPLLGEITVAGKTKEQVDRDLREKLSQYITGEIRLTISLVSKRENIITVFGAVSRSDNFQLVDEISLFELLSMASGPASDADLRHVKIYRRDYAPNYSEINLNEYLEKGQLDPSIKVGPGDIVYIPREQNFIREFSGFLRDVVLVFGLFSFGTNR
ncbi:polysaccharide biosynthesis/export family protein [Balneola sp. MJW-20]|uniref:polysaccharide biosynthesis/export family protein n=1 Tax=Gracilimonas aurantiaca TaxID=3234185 RepID=UPI00390C35A5